MNRRLYRSRTDSVIGGVAGGVAEYLDMDPAIVRIVWAVLAIVTGGIFLVLYVVMWIAVPEAPAGGYPGAAPGSWTPPAPGAVPGWQAPESGTASAPPAGGEAQSQQRANDASAMPAEGATAPDATAASTETPGGGYAAGQGYAGEHTWSPAEQRHRGRGGAMVFGLVLVGLGVWFLVDEYLPGIDTDLLWPVGLVLLGAVLLFVSMRKSA
jgi:phage shock protein PspC (stress-responsive transcriptional regulator)